MEETGWMNMDEEAQERGLKHKAPTQTIIHFKVSLETPTCSIKGSNVSKSDKMLKSST